MHWLLLPAADLEFPFFRRLILSCPMSHSQRVSHRCESTWRGGRKQVSHSECAAPSVVDGTSRESYFTTIIIKGAIISQRVIYRYTPVLYLLRWTCCIHKYVCVYVRVYMSLSLSLSLYIYIYIYTHMCMYTHTHCIYIYIYIYT